jgi:dihydroneopterin aldolase
MEAIKIKDLTVQYHVGVPDTERAKPQRLLVSVEMKGNFGKACETDELSATIDYGAVSRRLQVFGEGRSWKLIEKLAADIGQMILEEFGAAGVEVEVKKFIIPQAKYVSVKMARPAKLT